MGRWTKRNNNRIRKEGGRGRLRGLLSKQADRGARCGRHVWRFDSSREWLGASAARRPARPGFLLGGRRFSRTARWLAMASKLHFFGLMRVTLLDAIGRTGTSVAVQSAMRLGTRRPMNQRARRKEGHAENEGRQRVSRVGEADHLVLRSFREPRQLRSTYEKDKNHW